MIDGLAVAMWHPVGQSSFLESLVDSATVFEIVLDNAKSHADFCETVEAVKKRTSMVRKSKGSVRQETKNEQEELELDLGDLRDCAPTDDRLYYSYPRRENVPGARHKAVMCRWASSSSDSDFAHVPCHFSFDRMLKEASSATKSARTNVSRPTRRNSIMSCH